MNRILKTTALAVTGVFAVGVAGGAWWLHSEQPQRDGSVMVAGLQDTVSVRFDERGVPHIDARNEADMYRALGYVHAQDRLFQMEMTRRLARGQLAEVMGPDSVDVDRLFRTLGIDAHARQMAARMDPSAPATRALTAYLAGINAYQDTHPSPMEFDIIGIPKRPFTPVDTYAMLGFMAYGFAAALKVEPLMTYVRDKLGAAYLEDFDLQWHAKGVLPAQLTGNDWTDLKRLASLSQRTMHVSSVPQFMGSNGWAVAGTHTASGRPLLAGDPHIGFSVPSVWYEAHVRSPGFELYGHYGTLPFAMLGHNMQSGWTLTMFENDDMDLIAEKVNPANPNQVWAGGQWVDMTSQEETIAVKGAAPVHVTLRHSPHGPIINDALDATTGKTPIAMWWAFLETPNPILEAFYDLPYADTLAKARTAASMIDAPGFNLIWANAAGDIGWWAAARIPKRPAGVNPRFILDGSLPESEKSGFYPFDDNPHEENPARGYVVSANHQSVSPAGIEIPGYYLPPDRVQRLDALLSQPAKKWDTQNSQALQLDVHNSYAPRLIHSLLPALREAAAGTPEAALIEQLAAWNGDDVLDAVEPTLYFQFVYELARAAMADELGEDRFKTLLQTYEIDPALEHMATDPQSAWWDDHDTQAVETRADIVRVAWNATLAHLRATFGTSNQWTWGRAHTLTHGHPLGTHKPLDIIFNVGPFAAPGGHETPNNLNTDIGPAPWAVINGPSTRRLIDFANPAAALGINPVGQSGVWGDAHYADQAKTYIEGGYVPEHMAEADVARATRSTLTLQPLR